MRNAKGAIAVITVVIVAVLGLYLTAADAPWLRRIEVHSLDIRFHLRGPEKPDTDIAVVLVDERTVGTLGSWPVNRAVLADGIRYLADDGAAVIGVDILFAERSHDQPADVRAALRAARAALGDDDAAAAEIDAMLNAPSPDDALAQAVRDAGNVVLPYAFRFDGAAEPAPPDPVVHESRFHRLTVPPGSDGPELPWIATGVVGPVAPIGDAAVAMGHVTVVYDVDGAIRLFHPVIEYDWEYYPGFPLQIVSRYLGVPWDEVALEFGRGITIGDRFLPTDQQTTTLVNYHGPRDTFDTYSFIDVLQGRIPPGTFRDRIVLLGATVLGAEDTMVTPFTPSLPGVERYATLIDRILTGEHIARPHWAILLDCLAIILGGLLCGLAAMRASAALAASSGVLLLALWWAVAYAAFAYANLWLNVLFPSLAIAGSGVAVVSLRGIRDERRRRRAELALAASEERYALAARGTNDGLWDWDLSADRIYYSPRWCRMVDSTLPADGTVAEPQLWFDRVVPEDLPGLRRAIDDHLAGRSPNLVHEYCIGHSARDQRWMLVRGQCVAGEDGKPVRMAGSLTDITARKAQARAIKRLAYRCPLTRLANRTLFQRQVEESISGNVGPKASGLDIAIIDLDHFKDVNDALGHDTGDALLSAVAGRLVATATDAVCIARLAANTFAVAMPHRGRPPPLDQLPGTLTAAFGQPFAIGPSRLHITACIGLARYPDHGDDAQTLIERADMALNRAKTDGRGHSRWFDQDMATALRKRVQLTDDLREAVAAERLTLFYQPQFDLKTGAVCGAEALMRWPRPEGGFISPGEFIPVSETSGLIVPMGAWALLEACRKAKGWQDAGLPPFRVAVNISTVQFRDGDLEGTVRAALEASGLEPRWLEMEVTESAVMQDVGQALALLETLKGIGVEIAIDDFGTGYSSLSYLKRFPVDRLKIDQAFVRDLTTDADDRAIAAAVIDLGHTLGLKVIAEGIETPQHVDFLHDRGCDEGQGFHYSRPVPAEELFRFVAAHNQALQA